MSRFLSKLDVDIISHLDLPIKFTGIPSIAWIPDFQHKYLPEFFSAKELQHRDQIYKNLALIHDAVILSSHDAEKDFKGFFKQYEYKAKVLQFVSNVNHCLEYDRSRLKKEYDISTKFFYLPNQYWKHKNHKIVLEALKILKDEGKYILIVSTGNTKDFRNPDYFTELVDYIKEHELESMYHILGMIEYNDVQMLSKECAAFLNPSLFEGWSTTVEEAKSMGKPILLSNIAVHLEQSPSKGIFFNPADAHDLADKLWKQWTLDPLCIDEENLVENNKTRRRIFANQYRNILDDVLNTK